MSWRHSCSDREAVGCALGRGLLWLALLPPVGRRHPSEVLICGLLRGPGERRLILKRRKAFRKRANQSPRPLGFSFLDGCAWAGPWIPSLDASGGPSGTPHPTLPVRWAHGHGREDSTMLDAAGNPGPTS